MSAPGLKPGMPRREFLRNSATAAALAAILGPDALAAETERKLPSIIFILCDDLGYGDLGCYGSKTIATPNVDGLAKRGVRFTDYYSGYPVCTPSRTCFLTGRYPIRAKAGLTRVLGPASKNGIPDSEVTVGKILQDRGYATAIIGKWHLGSLPQYFPMRHGFDYWYGIPYSNNMGKYVDGMVDCPLYRNDEIIERPVNQNTLTQRYTEECINFIGKNRDRPFFLYMAHTMPHNPVHASERFRGTSKAKLYGDAVQEIDWGVGRIIKGLMQLGLEKNTLVIFTSDNGPNGGSARPLRGGKTQVFEGGVRVPFVAHWPGRITPSLCHEPASNLDMLPTFASLAGAKAPVDRVIDGRNITRLLTVPGASTPDYPFYYFRTQSLQAVRYGRWKLHVGRGTETLAEPELYDLELDMSERVNVTNKHPEIVAKLKKMIDDFHKTLPAQAEIGGSAEAF